MNRSFTLLSLFAFLFAVTAHAIPVQVSNAPEDNLSLTVNSINGAQKSIFLNIYELSSPDIADALLARVRAGVQVVILEEGSPVGGMSTAAKGIESSLAVAMNHFKADHFFQMSKGTTPRRYHFDHAKYAVIDDQALLIGSENYSPTGNPAAGTLGNRGWEVFIQDLAIAQNFKSVFLTDSSTQFGDVKDLTTNPPLTVTPVTSGAGRATQSAGDFSATQVTRITSPDSSLSGLLGLINNARTSIAIEQMSFDSTWNTQAGASPLTAAVIAAARRGVKVRVLLNDGHVFDHPGRPAAPHNTDTIALFNNIPNIEARTANIQAMGVDYIHNKGMLVDGSITLISSINWDQNSIQNNREAAVAITSPSINGYYQTLFDKDWAASATSSSTPPPPANLLTSVRPSSTALACPTSLHLEVNVQTLNIRDSEDSDFASLSGQHISSDFIAAPGITGCVLVQGTDERPIHSTLTLELRQRGSSILFTLEGYTPRTRKLYSIRGNLQDLTLPKNFTATLYDGSGPSREALGSALVEAKQN